MQKRIAILASLFLTVFSSSVFANFTSGQTPKMIYGADTIRFGVDNPPAGKVCDSYGRHFQFDATTEGGKNILSMLLAAEMADRKIDIWYIESSTPDTTHANGCVTNTMAKLLFIGLVD